MRRRIWEIEGPVLMHIVHLCCLVQKTNENKSEGLDLEPIIAQVMR